MEQRVKTLETLIAQKAGAGNTSPSWRPGSCLDTPLQDSPMARTTTETPPSASTGDVSLNLSCSLGAFPASSITDQPVSDAGQSPNTKLDLIARGLLSEQVARALFDFYHEHLDRHIYHLLARSGSLAEVRSRSSLLTAAICTVAALASASSQYDNCLRAFTAEVAGELFSKDHTFDDIRALCIGSFWLGDISVALCALGKTLLMAFFLNPSPSPYACIHLTPVSAVRFSSELNLHRCITKMPHTKWKCYERTRLYFLVFICDHHSSLKHGRPPMTRAMRSLQNPRALLRGEFSVPSDAKLISHLELWSLSNRVFDLFGADVGSPFDPRRGTDLEQLSHYFDEWRRQWTDSLARRDALDEFEQHSMDLYFYSAKLCLFAHVFRGPPSRAANNNVGGTAALARKATECALAFVGCVAAGGSGHAAPLMPSYLVTITAFASVFLLGTSSSVNSVNNGHQPTFPLNKGEVLEALRRLFAVLDEARDSMHRAHPFLVVANGLYAALGSRQSSDPDRLTSGGGNNNNVATSPSSTLFDFRLLPKDILGLASTQNIDWTALSTDFEADASPDLWNVDIGTIG